ncbi:MAG: gas vesicle protein [Scytonema sp. PMC 1069.18]|nr:gas vesicle protein [Scytonema sp. PMC 1069.18]MEC4887030.1 gas vesicle protein [Scytonema sp. PMC 1070.18]
MRKNRHRGLIRNKISTMPHQQSEASCQLSLYKLVTEQQRIKQELTFMENRIFILQQRLDVINHQIAKTEGTIEEFRQTDSSSTQVSKSPNLPIESNNFQTFYFEY